MARISACREARVRKLEATKAKRATKRELIVVATMIARMIVTSAFSDRTEFSVSTTTFLRQHAVGVNGARFRPRNKYQIGWRLLPRGRPQEVSQTSQYKRLFRC